jgi:galactose-1-phosphate uridylyltransferase
MNLLIYEFLKEDPARLKGAAGMRIGLNSTIRHLVMGKSHRSSAGASVAHVHKQVWGMLPGSINLGDHLRHICNSFGTQTSPLDYLKCYRETLRMADLVLWEDPSKLVTLYVPFGQISIHELQIMVNREGVGNYLQLTREEIHALSRAEYIATRLYQKMGIQSFNEVLLTQPFSANEEFVRLILTFVTREIDIAVSELNLLYVVDKLPEASRDEIRVNLDAVLAELDS